jgi:DNA ligase (NAD+)
MNDKDEYEKMKREVARHDWLYHVESRPEISDAEYDRLYRRLEEIERAHPDWAASDSPTRKVGGAPLQDFKKVAHRLPLLSLEKVYAEAELRDWLGQMERELGRTPEWRFTVEPKIDGDSLELVYDKGVLVQASTRGDGRIGEEVTHTVRTIRAIPLRLDGAPDLLEVRGEAYIALKDFQAINRKQLEKGGEPYANPRNLTSGSIKQKDPSITAARPLRFLAHGLGLVKGRKFSAHAEALAWLKKLRFPVVPIEICRTLEEVQACWARMLEAREKLDHEIDGVVVKADDLEIREALGARSKSPRWAIAYKFPAREENTRVLGIDWQVGRSGKLTPVARLQPVFLSGVTVSNATLHNPAQLEKLDVRVGDTVVVTRSGDVIPYVVKVIPTLRPDPTKKVEVPAACPTCGAKTERTEADVFCPDRAGCPDQLKGRIDHFCSRAAMNIEGLGPEWIDQFVDQGFVKSVADLYALTKEKLLNLERMGGKLAQNMLDAIAGSKETTLARFLNALGIVQVGEATANALADHFGDLEKTMKATVEELQEVQDVGPKVAESIRAFFAEARNVKVVDELLAHGLRFKKPDVKSRSLAGQVVVFTGGLEIMTRDEARQTVLEHGGKTADSVSKNATIVVAGPGAGSKLDKAKKLGIRILDEGAFLKLVGK